MYYNTDKINLYIEQLKYITPEKYHFFLTEDGFISNHIVLTTLIDDVVVGVIIAVPDEGDNLTYTVIHLFVRKNFRRTGIATGLINSLTKIIKKNNYNKLAIITNFKRKSENIVFFKKFILKNQFGPLILKKTEFYSSNKSFVNEKWYTLNINDDYEMILWKDITLSDKKYLQSNKEKFMEKDKMLNEYYIDPFNVIKYDLKTSYCIRKKSTGNIVAWNLTERNINNFVVYRKLYVTFEERNSGILYPLISKSILTCMNDSNGICFLVQGVNRRMRIGIDIMMGHLCDTIIETYCCIKEIN